MKRELVFSDEATDNLDELEHDPSQIKIYKAVNKTLGLMETNLRHPSLNTHEYTILIRRYMTFILSEQS